MNDFQRAEQRSRQWTIRINYEEIAIQQTNGMENMILKLKAEEMTAKTASIFAKYVLSQWVI